MSFDEALRVLKLTRMDGPKLAGATYLKLREQRQHEDPGELARLDEAWAFLKNPGVWPKAALAADRELPAPLRPRAAPSTPEQGARPVETAHSQAGAGDETAPAGRPRGRGRGGDRKRPITDFFKSRHEARARMAQAALGSTGAAASPEKPSPPPVVSDIDSVLADVARAHPRVDPVAIRAAIDTGEADCASPFVRDLITVESVVDAASLAAALYRLMDGEPERQWLQPKSVLRLIFKMHSLVPEQPLALDAAVRVQTSLDRWKAGAGNTRVAFDRATTDRWKWADELAELSDHFPGELRATIAAACLGGGAHEAREDVGRWLKKHKKEAPLAARQLKNHAPVLAEVYGEQLTAISPAEPLQETSRRSQIPAWSWKALIAVAVLGLLLNWLAREGAPDSGLSEQLVFDRMALCQHFGDGSPGCVWANVVTRALDESDCGLLEKAMPRLLSRVQSGRLSVGAVQAPTAQADHLTDVMRRLRTMHDLACSAP